VKRSRSAKRSQRQRARPSATEDVIAIDISDTPEFVGLLGLDPRLYERTDSLTLLCGPAAKTKKPKRATAEQVFFAAIAEARDARSKPSRAKRAKPRRHPRLTRR
jgi:hypothetical protein